VKLLRQSLDRFRTGVLLTITGKFQQVNYLSNTDMLTSWVPGDICREKTGIRVFAIRDLRA